MYLLALVLISSHSYTYKEWPIRISNPWRTSPRAHDDTPYCLETSIVKASKCGHWLSHDFFFLTNVKGREQYKIVIVSGYYLSV
jgi:hypothetical protein